MYSFAPGQKSLLQNLCLRGPPTPTVTWRSYASAPGDALKAVQHWKTYLKLDSRGQWADIARRQLERLRQATLVHSR